MTNYLIIPGLGNSGPEHWQTYFEKSSDSFHRVTQKEWDAPVCSDWVETINQAISKYDPNTLVLIGHSLGCATIAHWAKKYGNTVKGAMLVAPSDLESPMYTFPAIGFDPIPLERMKFKTIVVASSDDPWVTLDRAKYFVANWGSDFINIGSAGHINTASGYGNWEHGLEILKAIN